MTAKTSSYRGKNYFRAMRERAIARKMRKSHYYAPDGYYEQKNRYSKNKIHCSCHLCSVKSADDPMISDIRKLAAYNQQLRDYYNEIAC